jgi:hypothetical protein
MSVSWATQLTWLMMPESKDKSGCEGKDMPDDAAGALDAC